MPTTPLEILERRGSLGSHGPNYSVEVANKAGLGLQLLAFKGWEGEALEFIPSYMAMSCEWDFWQAPTRIDQLRQFRSMSWDDRKVFMATKLALFGSYRRALARMRAITARFPDMLQVDRPDWFASRKGLVEISPVGRDKRSGQGFDFYLSRDQDVVWDTWHMRALPGYRMAECECYAEQFLERGMIKLVHFQTRDKCELDRFRGGERNALHHLLALGVRSGAPIIIELDPRHVPDIFGKRTRFLLGLRHRIEDCWAAA
jgi:hypothetical protein